MVTLNNSFHDSCCLSLLVDRLFLQDLVVTLVRFDIRDSVDGS